MHRKELPGTAATTDANHAAHQAGLLMQEVSFWQDMLLSMEDSGKPREQLERVHQALALAQYRLSQLQHHPSH